mmetsp:Transcript_16673/g.23343  ORF Transcript_16673/g.23343 Transcript_16673/m.23343 type:complete len:96 (+) Transcript_16673:88-375(+)
MKNGSLLIIDSERHPVQVTENVYCDDESFCEEAENASQLTESDIDIEKQQILPEEDTERTHGFHDYHDKGGGGGERGNANHRSSREIDVDMAFGQ